MSVQQSAPRRAPVRPAPVRRTLRPVPAARPATRRAPFVALVVTLLAGGLVGLLFLNTSTQDGAFELHRLEKQAQQLQSEHGAIALQVEQQSAPEAVADRAARLGMVPNTDPAFLRLSDGKVIGKPAPATRQGTEASGVGGPSPAAVGERQ